MNQLLLQAVQQLFIEWRQQKKYAREKVPNKLWKAAAQLIPEYSITKLTCTLKISKVSLKKKIEKYHASIDPSSKEIGFVEVSLPSTNSRSLSAPIAQSTTHCERVEIQRKDGNRLILYSQEGNILDGMTLIRAFLGEKDAPNCTTN